MESQSATHLLLDCAFAGVTLALARVTNGRLCVLGQYSAAVARSSDTLAPALQKLMAETGTSAQNLTDAFVTVGPGSFTGCRLGLAVAEALRLVNPSLKVTGLSTMEAVARQVGQEEPETRPMTVLLDAAGGQVYLQSFVAVKAKADPICLPVAEALKACTGHYVVAQSSLMLNVPHTPVVGLRAETLAFCAQNPALALPAEPVYIKPLTYKKAVEHQIDVWTMPNATLAAAAATWQNPLLTHAEVTTHLAQPEHVLLWHPSGAHLLACVPQGGVADVLTLWTPAAERRKGYASALLAFLKAIAQKAACTAVTLEVRASNVAAIGAYTQAGFSAVSVRKGYYPAAGGAFAEDAQVLSQQLQ